MLNDIKAGRAARDDHRLGRRRWVTMKNVDDTWRCGKRCRADLREARSSGRMTGNTSGAMRSSLYAAQTEVTNASVAPVSTPRQTPPKPAPDCRPPTKPGPAVTASIITSSPARQFKQVARASETTRGEISDRDPVARGQRAPSRAPARFPRR